MSPLILELFLFCYNFLLSGVVADVRDLIELIPCDLLATLFMEYVAVDVQVHKLLYYITTDHFHKNLVMFETSEAFNEVVLHKNVIN